MNTNEGLCAVDLCKSFDAKQVVSDVSLQVKSSESVGLLGANGAGKTTSFYLMAGILYPDRGRVFLHGKDISSLPIHIRAKRGMGYLPQETSIFQKMTVEDNLLSIMEVCGVKRRERSALLNKLLGRFHLIHVRKLLAVSLSGGERRRVEIARALIGRPDFLLLDEPFSGIDPMTVQEIQNIIKELTTEGLGVLITDHNVRETLRICDQVCVLAQGRVIACGSPDEVATDERVISNYLGSNFQKNFLKGV